MLHQSTSTPADRLGIAAAIGCITLAGVSLSLSVPLLALAMEARGASGSMIGANTALAGLAVMIVAPLLPRLAAIFGVTSLLLGALALGAATSVAFYFVEPLWAWFPLRFLFGGAFATLFVVSEFWINAAAPPKSRGLVMGLYGTALSVGFSAGPAIVAWTGLTSFTPYAICAALFALAAFPVFAAGGSAPRIERPEAGRGVLFFIRLAPAATLAGFTFGAIETGGFTFLPIYGVRIGLTPGEATLLGSAVAIGNVLWQMPIGLLSDRMDRRLLLLLIGVLGLAGALAIPYVSQWPIPFYVMLALWGGAVSGLYTVGLALIGSRFSGVDLATANAAFVVMYSLGMLVGPPVLGAGFDVWNPHGAPLAMAAILLAYIVLIARRRRAP
ncbi:MFS transporter [Hansschlegelia quercus]|uniref:MFS transporter n=1 Tax=Hansschlegelia quercus TaxID=2528245 RepID=A0A4Q9GQR5_9HYPH|nr:MFS transporter [Hansschlegelia quercus]TBN54390.1 MFS transporter [Hansschlegelia quercus]